MSLHLHPIPSGMIHEAPASSRGGGVRTHASTASPASFFGEETNRDREKETSGSFPNRRATVVGCRSIVHLGNSRDPETVALSCPLSMLCVYPLSSLPVFYSKIILC